MSKLLLAFVFVLTSVSVTGTDGAGAGRSGNNLYEDERYEEAAVQYRAGLSQIEEEVPGHIIHGLYNNLGSALHRHQDYENATAAFARAMDLADNNEDFARAAYNAGNNAFRAQNMEASLEFYKNALLTDPNNLDAKFNYEFVKRQMQNQQNQDQNQDGDQQQQDQQNQDQQNENNEDSQDQQQQDQQNQQNQDQNGDQQQDQQNQDPQNQDQSGDQQQDQQPQPNPNDLSREQAERILQALERDEKDLLRKVKKMNVRPRSVEKDW